MCLLALDASSLCVVILIVAFTALWAYVTFAKERAQLPNLTSAILEVAQKSNNGQAGNKKAPKSKSKKKQVEGGIVKVVSKNVRRVASATDVPQKGSEDKEVVKSKESQVKKSKSDSVRILNEKQNEGEWQTQLSRPQLRALRQRQRTDEQKSQEANNSEGNSNTGLEEPESVGHSGRGMSIEASESTSSTTNGSGRRGKTSSTTSGDSRGVTNGSRRRGKGVQASKGTSSTTSGDSGGVASSCSTTCASPCVNETTAAASPGVMELLADGVKERPESQNSQSSGGMNSDNLEQACESKSTDLFLASLLPVADVETALVEAARSSVSSIEEESSNAVPDVATKKTLKKKKSRRKNKQVGKTKPQQEVEVVTADSMEPDDSSFNQEEWVVIN